MRSIVPRDKAFFDLFDQMAAVLREATDALVKLVEAGAPYEHAAAGIKTLEKKADELTRDTLGRLQSTFVTPLDRGDIHRLVSRMDDVLDRIDSAATRFDLYAAGPPPLEAGRLAAYLQAAGVNIQEMIGLLPDLRRKGNRIMTLCAGIRSLEEEADEVWHGSLGRLFREVEDPIEIIRWKDILERIEGAMDRCQDVAAVVEGIVLENA